MNYPAEANLRPAPAKPLAKQNPWPRRVLVATVAAVVFLAGMEAARMLGGRAPFDEAVTTHLPLVRVAPAERGPSEIALALPGDITAFEDSPVYARVNGYVRHWTVDIGAKVKAGQVLAEIETPELHEQLKQAQALVLQAKANAEIAGITHRRYLNLVKTNAVSQQDVDNAQAAVEARRADVAAAEAEVGRLTAMVGFQKIYAPFDGVIGARNLAKASTGALIDLGSHDPNGWLYRVYRMDPVRVYVAVPQNYLPMVKDGLAADVKVREYPDRSFTGRVVRNAAALNATSRTLQVEVEAPNPDGILLPGMYSTVHFRLVDAAPPIVVADTAIIVRDAGPHIAIVDKDDVVHIRSVRLGRDFGKSVEVLSGCAVGDRIVIAPRDLLQNGAKVRVQTNPPSRS